MNLVEPGLALLEGMALIASPCILPVLPLVLSSSIEGGKGRPFGIITGFVLAFSAFALASRWIITALGLDLDWIKYGSLVLLGLFGLILLSKTLSDKFNVATQGAANYGARLTSGPGHDGFFSGIGIGALIGLVWTPCAGPLLAAVLVQVIRQENDLDGLIIMLAFSLGAGLPMLLIALMGRKIVGKLGFFKRHGEALRRTFGVLILLAVGLLASGFDVTTLLARKELTLRDYQQQSQQQPDQLVNALPAAYPAPDFAQITQWLNSPPLKMADLRGKVVLIDFWTYSCINCVRTLPYVTAWDRQYRDKGLVIIGVHAPEFEFEKKSANVKTAIAKHDIRYPVALDNQLGTWTQFKNRYWPAHYLINQQGDVVYTHFGEGNYALTEHNIRTLLGLDKDKPSKTPPEETRAPRTPETYLGSARAENFASPQPLRSGSFTLPGALPNDHWALQGLWTVGPEHITAAAPDAALRLNFTARKVFLVLGSKTGAPVRVTLKLNGRPLPALTVTGHSLYELLDQSQSRNSLLDLTTPDAGLEAYAFTFG